VLAVIRRWEVYGVENLPRRGGAIVISNHISYWDPVVVACALNRRVYFMAKAELFKIPLLGPVIKKLGAFPVRRNGPDPSSVRRSIQLLKNNKIIGIFPEGTRSHSGEILDPHLGAAMLALKVGVPIVPVAVTGTKGVVGKVFVSVGKPLEFKHLYRRKNDKGELEAVSRKIMAEVENMQKGMK
jgi:1-acyl-sn-glycerol-3-phosphate acyltransferase